MPASLEQDQDFIALSYTWGNPAQLCKITTNGQYFPIIANLASFLQHQRYTTYDRGRFWIDAICINQKDISEVNDQVAMMGDIFKAATEAYVWFCPEAEYSSVAFDLISRPISEDMRPKKRASESDGIPTIILKTQVDDLEAPNSLQH